LSDVGGDRAGEVCLVGEAEFDREPGQVVLAVVEAVQRPADADPVAVSRQAGTRMGRKSSAEVVGRDT
jgi:hypothetical protein